MSGKAEGGRIPDRTGGEEETFHLVSQGCAVWLDANGTLHLTEDSEDYAFLLANVRDAVGDDE